MPDAPARRPRSRFNRASLLAMIAGGALVLVAAATPAWYPAYARFHPLRPPFAGGVALARRLAACARTWSVAHGSDAPPDLAAVADGDPRCAATASGWRVAYERDVARGTAFHLVVRERVAPFTIYRSVSVGDDGVLHVAERAGDAGTTDAVLTNVPRELWRIGECVSAVVAARPGHEFPRSLGELGPRGEGCDILSAARWTADSGAVLTVRWFAGGSTVDERYRFTWSVIGDSLQGWRARVDARPVHHPQDGVRSYALVGDEVHATPDDRAATADDPVVDRCEEFWSRPGCARAAWLGWARVPGDGKRSVAPSSGGAPGPVLAARDKGIAWSAPLGDHPDDSSAARLGAPSVGTDGSVYAGSPGGVFAFGPTGAHRWARRDLVVVDGGAVALVDDILLAPTRDSGVVALDATTGRTRWASRAVPGVLAHAPIPLPNGAAAVANRDGRLTVFEHDGRVRWTKRLGSAFDAAPVADGRGTLYVLVEGRETELLQVTAEGVERRHTRVGAWTTPPLVLADGSVLVASGAGLFVAEAKGGPARKLAASASDADRLVARTDGTVLFTDGARLIAMAPNGRQLWSWQPANRPRFLAGPAALPDGAVVLADADYLRVFTATGDSAWVVRHGAAAPLSTPVVGPDGTVYLVDRNWRLTAIRDANAAAHVAPAETTAPAAKTPPPHPISRKSRRHPRPKSRRTGGR